MMTLNYFFLTWLMKRVGDIEKVVDISLEKIPQLLIYGYSLKNSILANVVLVSLKTLELLDAIIIDNLS